MIRVIDDGHGMTHDDALLAFERHATSKLKTADDLLSISTLGFRGEALPTIAAVSRLLLETRDEAEAEGTRIEFAGGKLIGVKPAGLPPGTTVSVADLSIPFRRAEISQVGHHGTGPHRFAGDAPTRWRIRASSLSWTDADAGNHQLPAGGKAGGPRISIVRAAGAGRAWSKSLWPWPLFARQSRSRSWKRRRRKRR